MAERGATGPDDGVTMVGGNGAGLDGTVVILDSAATIVGEMDKLTAHGRPPTPHLAFSVVLFDATGAVLLQRRAAGKYNFAGRWSNTCCSHPRPGEPVRDAARRRLVEELAVDCGRLEVRGAFWYRADDPASGLAEHEYDVVLVGRIRGVARPDPTEASEVALRPPDEVLADYRDDPGAFTPWLPMVLRTALGPPRRVAANVPL
jgi:isopentenyl-diphosphate delta-isomerase